MADLGGQFDAESVDPMGEFTPIPSGEYKCVIAKSEWKDTKDGAGKYLEFTFQVVEGDYTGKTVKSRLNLNNKSQQAVSIARSELSSICRAVGVLKPRDSGELHNVPLVLKVAVKKREDNGEPANEVKGYSSVAKHKEAQPAGASTATDKPAWM